MTTATLLYDGDCAFCRYCVNYARARTGDKVDYQPYQTARRHLASLSEADCRAAIQLLYGDSRYQGAGAAFRVLAIGGSALWWWAYRYLPGFAPLSEALYRWVSRHRRAAHRVSRWCWGDTWMPARFEVTARWFLRLLGVIYLFAFASLGWQILGLVGSGGLAPLDPYLQAVTEAYGTEGYRLLPTLFWFAPGDGALVAATLAGGCLALLVIFNRWVLLSLFGCYCLYLSLVHAGQDFTRFQWDMLLLECGFAALLLWYSRPLGIWLLRWLMFRFMWMSGLAKVTSGDFSWANWTALTYHFETQPLPTPLAWYAHHLPDYLLKGATGLTLVVELIIPFFIFLPRRPRQFAAAVFALLQVLILLTGNYTFFNLLTLALCLVLLDDRALQRLGFGKLRLGFGPKDLTPAPPVRRSKLGRGLVGAVAAVVFSVGIGHIWTQAFKRLPGSPLADIMRAAHPFHISNRYGLFAIMTQTRPEIVIEGSSDGINWQAYTFRYKPGDPNKELSWNIPHQPRLDWQLWFAGLDGEADELWFETLLIRLLQGNQSVLALFGDSPFTRQPPLYVRARLFLYTYKDVVAREVGTGVWQRQDLGEFYSPMRLADTGDYLYRQSISEQKRRIEL
ncbi:DUF393 domain-containing protein [Exilibacterium tricleocarpae]|uniref:Lipase maturation factor 2 n=1 Tax=Exilibacterium tricleocarpae TaxID=2591008 RepID=A0A545TFS0_9GAMM|nr:lipase maturation factor family protein [Exilibacterium tricleocarpae]TQV76026.1 DUF393 domain-containing protein [Exilibacterium tricleocarpae]